MRISRQMIQMIIPGIPHRHLYFFQKDIIAFRYQNASRRSKEVLAELYNYMVQPAMTERVKQGLISSLLDLGISVTCFKHKNLAKVASVNHDCASKVAIIHGFIMVSLSFFHMKPLV